MPDGHCGATLADASAILDTVSAAISTKPDRADVASRQQVVELQSKVHELQAVVADAKSRLPSQKLEVEKLAAAISTKQDRGKFASAQQVFELQSKVRELTAVVLEATKQDRDDFAPRQQVGEVQSKVHELKAYAVDAISRLYARSAPSRTAATSPLANRSSNC